MAKKSSTASAPTMDPDWRAESDHRTMMDAADIQSERGRMAGVRKHHRKQTKKMSLVQRQMTGAAGMSGGRR